MLSYRRTAVGGSHSGRAIARNKRIGWLAAPTGAVHRCQVEGLDERFDRLIPRELKHLSSLHWTPVPVALRVAALLSPTPSTVVLDIGAGVGKLCSIGAVSTRGTWVGVEQHGTYVQTARNIANALGVADRTCFLQADAFAIDWNDFAALYLYNPFEVPVFEPPGRRGEQVRHAQARLAKLPCHTRVVTLHGFGGVMPRSFELDYHERMTAYSVDLAVWRQCAHHMVSVPP